jgi:hypothetical protein
MKKNITKSAIVIILFLSGKAVGQNLAPADMLTIKGHYIHSAIMERRINYLLVCLAIIPPKTLHTTLYFIFWMGIILFR